MNKAHFSWLFYGFDEIVQQSCWLALEWNVKFQRFSYVGIWWLIWCWTSNSRITCKIGVHCRIYSEHLGIILNNSILSPSVEWIFLFGEFTNWLFVWIFRNYLIFWDAIIFQFLPKRTPIDSPRGTTFYLPKHICNRIPQPI